MTEQRPPTVPHPVMMLTRQFSVALTRVLDLYGEQAGLHRTDLQALSVLMDAASTNTPVTAGHLAHRLGLSSPATTALLDRLTKAGHVERTRSPQDRRVVHISSTTSARALGRSMFTPLGHHVTEVLQQYSDDDLALLSRLLTDLCAATDRAHSEALASMDAAAAGCPAALEEPRTMAAPMPTTSGEHP